jgi:hypothetical protein
MCQLIPYPAEPIECRLVERLTLGLEQKSNSIAKPSFRKLTDVIRAVKSMKLIDHGRL